MAADWLGSVVSINCGLTLGVYQGEVSSVDHKSQTISLRQLYHNGVRCPLPEVTFSAMDIKELKFLDIQDTVNKPSSGQGTATEPSFMPSSRHQSNRVSHPQVTSSSSHSNAAPITILRRDKMPVCFVPECPHSSRNGCKFYRFPSDKRARNRWLQLIRNS